MGHERYFQPDRARSSFTLKATAQGRTAHLRFGDGFADLGAITAEALSMTTNAVQLSNEVTAMVEKT
jgi:hypothetical protein